MSIHSLKIGKRKGLWLTLLCLVALPILIPRCGGSGGIDSMLGRHLGTEPSSHIFMNRDSEFVCGEPSVQDLTAGQNIDIGSLIISNDENYLYVEFVTDEPWVLGTTHVHVGFHEDDVPKSGNGQPIPGQFDYKRERDVEGGEPGVTEDEYSIPFTDLGLEPGECDIPLFIWAHAESFMLGEGGVVVQEETAFGGDTPGDGTPRWFFLAQYTLQCCEDDDPADGFRTQTQGGWGTTCHGNNPGCYRDDWFAATFGDELVIGCAQGFTATFTSSLAVENFLPTGGTPGVLGGHVVDPVAPTSAGVFMGQLLALELSISFDLADPNFSVSDENLIDQVICNTGTACDGMTVGELADEANIVIGGCEGSTDMTPAELSDCLAIVNENFVDGNTNNGMVCAPPA